MASHSAHISLVGLCMHLSFLHVYLLESLNLLTWIIVLISSSDPRNVKRCRDGPETETSRLLQRCLKYNRVASEEGLRWCQQPSKKVEPGRRELSEWIWLLRTGTGNGERKRYREGAQRKNHWRLWVRPSSRFEGKNWRFSTAAPACSWRFHIHKMGARD